MPNEKVIKLFAGDNRDKRGHRSYWYIFPTRELRALVHRRLLQKYPGELNYVLYWNDTQGYGLEMSYADWVEPGKVCFQP